MARPKTTIPKKKAPAYRRRKQSQPKKTASQKKWTKDLPLYGLIAIYLLGLYFFIFRDLPLPTKLQSQDYPVSTQILDRNGQLLYEIYSEKNRTPVTLNQLPQHVIQATLASEDKNFYEHHGFAFQGIFRAAYTIIFKGSLQGGSTITQQLVKNSLLTPERTVRRKVREALLTWATEFIYSKDTILEMYLNQVPYGGTAWGIEAAAQMYFDTSARDLDLAQAALLAGLPASPTRFSPFGSHPELAKGRQERVLDQMLELGFIDPESHLAAREKELSFAPVGTTINAPHFSLWIKEQLVEQFGERKTAQGGLRVTTTLDLELQNTTQNIVGTEIDQVEKYHITNGAALVVKPQTGEILAMVGSRDYFNQDVDGNVNVTLRPRQPGSSIKPLNYALGFETGRITPATVLNDVPTCFQITGQPLYCPVNYDGGFHGPTAVRFALGNSYNIPAVKVLALNGLQEFINFATKMGITTFREPERYGLSLTLGGGEVTMYDHAQAFSVFANNGLKIPLFAIQKIEDWQGRILFEHEEEPPVRVISSATAYLISHILLDNNARMAAFGSYSDLVIKNHPEVSAKTGTTNDMRDNWTIGFTPDFLTVVWVGNNDNTPMSRVASGVMGASPIWNEIMTFVLTDQKERWPLKPEEVVGRHVCVSTGLLPGDQGCETRFEYLNREHLPDVQPALQRGIAVDRTTARLATTKTPPENIEIQDHLVFWDPLGTPYCFDCAFPTERLILNSDFSVGNLPTPGNE